MRLELFCNIIMCVWSFSVTNVRSDFSCHKGVWSLPVTNMRSDLAVANVRLDLSRDIFPSVIIFRKYYVFGHFWQKYDRANIRSYDYLLNARENFFCFLNGIKSIVNTKVTLWGICSIYLEKKIIKCNSFMKNLEV